jgi:exosortase J
MQLRSAVQPPIPAISPGTLQERGVESTSTPEKASSHLVVMLVLAALCWAAAAPLFWPSATTLMGMWSTDDLKSMGALVPLVCFALILRAWRSTGWTTRGSWWGLGLLAGLATLVFVRDRTELVITVDKSWLVQLPPLPLVAVAFALGYVLLLGGTRLLRAAWFPVVLMWMVIPVPQTFSRKVDLPLQHISALVARSFAHQLGAPLTADRLRLMFTPEFGMFIAPGCNGIRGAVTLGLAALIISYLYRFRWFVFAPIVAGAVLLGYVFNLLRLCLLVVYYKIALPYPWLQQRAEMGDYLIGGALFLLALAIFFTVANRLRERPSDVRPATAPKPLERTPLRPYILRAVALMVVALFFGGEYFHLRAREHMTLRSITRLPEHIGDYRLVDRYDDSLMDGVVVYSWGEYAGPKPGSPHIKLGVSPVLNSHDVELCHMTRGEDPRWHGDLSAATPAGTVDLSAFEYVDGALQWVEASTVCSSGECRQATAAGDHVTVVYATPHFGDSLPGETRRPVPVLIRVETGDIDAPPPVIAQQLSIAIGEFLRQANLIQLTEPYSHR